MAHLPSAETIFQAESTRGASRMGGQQAATVQPVADSRPHASIPLIPRRVLFGHWEKSHLRMSYDGTQLAYLAPLNGVQNLWLAPLAAPTAARPVTHDTGRGIRSYLWSYTNEHLLYIQDKDGDENWRLYSLHLPTGQVINLTPDAGVQARFQHVSRQFPEEILVGLNDRDPELHDVYRVNIRTGARHLVLKNEGFVDFYSDDAYQLRLAVRTTPMGGFAWLTPAATGTWKPFITLEPEDALTTSLVTFDTTGQAAYLVDSRGRNTAALVKLDLTTGTRTVLAEDPQVDARSVIVHPRQKHPQAVGLSYTRQRWHIVDPGIADDFARLRTVQSEDFWILSRSEDDQTWLVVYFRDDGWPRYYHYDRPSQHVRLVFVRHPPLEGQPLAPMHPVVLTARDGLKLVSYYTLPLGSDRDGDARPDSPLPLVLLVHGGPWQRDGWGFNAQHQWLANRGYAILSVNFRGSTGFGKAFVNASNGERGGKMHTDLLDAVDWAIWEGIAEAPRVAIMGASYGGYATLVGLTSTPERFACGVDLVGPSSLVTFLRNLPPYWRPLEALFTTRLSDHRTAEGRAFLEQRSPLTYAERIQRPLLIGQGAHDPRVKQAEAEQIVQAMQRHQLPITYVLYPDEGHSIVREANRLSFTAVAEHFLARCLGGRSEPIGTDMVGSSLTVPVGAEEIPGLPEALAAMANSRQ